jgi:hypothetical protein
VRQHTKWDAKGFEYVTLASRDSLRIAARFGTLPAGTTVADFDQHQTGGPWSFRKYLEGQESMAQDAISDLRSDVEEFGSETVLKLRRRTDKDFKLPKGLEGIPPKAEAAAEPVVADKRGKDKVTA